MSRLRQRAKQALSMIGIDPSRAVNLVAGTPRFVGEALAYRRAVGDGPFPLRLDSIYPILGDAGATAGATGGHYYHQDLWAARKVFARRPARHVDIGSRIDGFITHLLVFMPVEVIDIRPLTGDTEGLTFTQGDATTLAGFADDSLDSLSTLHAVEHFGLGRYGDPIAPSSWRLAVGALARVLAPGGRLYFSVPIGRERVVFNAHRVFSPHTVLASFPSLRLVSFSAVDDAGDFFPDADPGRFADAHFSCGLFELTK